ncbi:B4GA1-like protein [Mya arenaria]|uniref:Beta-1,4-glucuronyltransferase 1 n=2 Tax=Mya arenaria TaxID=6604 RepID=A0ABY7FDA4_MYAAR|nr:B4GA1-like protein [Mya arenaria]
MLKGLVWNKYNTTIGILVILLLCLQGLTVLLVPVLNTPHETGYKSKAMEENSVILQRSKKKLLEDLLMYKTKIQNAHTMDSSGTYMLLPNLIVPAGDKASASNLTICTQTTANHLHNLQDLTSVWTGPVSVTVFTHGFKAAHDLYTIVYYHSCFTNIARMVTFHIVYPISNPPQNLSSLLHVELRCDNHIKHSAYEENLNYASNIPYPHNVLRNIAITNSVSAYVLVIDIDLIPSLDLYSQFQQFVKRRTRSKSGSQERIVYVLPSFETNSDNVNFTKKSLLSRWSSGSVRPFYATACEKCQLQTDYELWRQVPAVSFLDIAYQVEWDGIWEPFYIALKEGLLPYDGRFKQYGFNRISQVCEMHLAGFQFAVFNNAFVVHQGFKEKSGFHSAKDEENRRNKELYNLLKHELKDRYPESNRHC